MAKYKVTFDTAFGNVSSYEEIIVEADTAGKAKYKVALMENIQFGIFVKYFQPAVHKVSDDTPITHKKYSNDNPDKIMRLEWERINNGLIQEI